MTSNYRGVCWHKARSKWRSQIRFNGKQRSLGYFHDEIEAAQTYDHFAKKLYGDFANLNFPKEIL